MHYSINCYTTIDCIAISNVQVLAQKELTCKGPEGPMLSVR